MARIQLQNITKSFTGQPLFLIEDIIIEPGEILWLRGPSGIGKSTLLNIIAGLKKPDRESRIQIGDTLVHELKATNGDQFRADNISFIFQTFNLLPELNVIENLLIHGRFNSRLKNLPTKVLRDEALAALTKLNLANKKNDSVETLSQGEKQRVAIATALLKKSPLILADEPTSSLDPENSTTVKELLVSTAKSTGATLLWVSHDTRLLNTAADGALTFLYKKGKPTSVKREAL